MLIPHNSVSHYSGHLSTAPTPKPTTEITFVTPDTRPQELHSQAPSSCSRVAVHQAPEHQHQLQLTVLFCLCGLKKQCSLSEF